VLDPERDRVEFQLLEWAFADHMPVLAVCRGMQVLNIAAGGTLHQDIASEVAAAGEHNYWQLKPRHYRAHGLEVEPETRLARLMGDAAGTTVNSLHHQSVRDLAPGFLVSARADDGVVEAIESDNGHFAVGVQWHPEALTDDAAMRGIFEGFVDEVRRYRPPLAHAA
jgi:putative glutamine amidotransferase